MIKDKRQLTLAQKRIDAIRNDLSDMKGRYPEGEWSIFAAPLITELHEVQDQIEEYQALESGSLADSVEGRLRQPVLLDEIGELLAKLRVASGLTQKEVAGRLGWKQANISRFENEDYQSQTIAKIAEYADGLGVWLYVVPEMEELGKHVHYEKHSFDTPSSSFETAANHNGYNRSAKPTDETEKAAETPQYPPIYLHSEAQSEAENAVITT